MQNLDSGDAFDKDKVFISSSSFL